jgi:hypothetical protein
MKFVNRIIIPWKVDLRAVTALVSKLRFELDRIRHTKWEDRQGEQGPDRNVTQYPVSQVEYQYDTVRPSVGNIVYPNLLPKLGQGHWGSLFHGRALRR